MGQGVLEHGRRHLSFGSLKKSVAAQGASSDAEDCIRAALLISNIRACSWEGPNFFDGIEAYFGIQERLFAESVYFSARRDAVLEVYGKVLPDSMKKDLASKLLEPENDPHGAWPRPWIKEKRRDQVVLTRTNLL